MSFILRPSPLDAVADLRAATSQKAHIALQEAHTISLGLPHMGLHASPESCCASGHAIKIGGLKQRALLEILLLQARLRRCSSVSGPGSSSFRRTV